MRLRYGVHVLFRLLLLVTMSLVAVPLVAASWGTARADDAAVRALVDAAAGRKASAQTRAESMEKLGALGPEAIPVLLELLKDPSANVRAVAANALGRISLRSHDERALDPLAHLLQSDPDPIVRANAALALGLTGNPRALAPLVAALDSHDVRIRRMAVVALTELRNPEAIGPLVHTFKQQDDMDTRMNVIRALAALKAREDLESLRPYATNHVLAAELDRQLAQLTAGNDRPAGPTPGEGR